MDERKDIITSKQLMIFLITGQIGTGTVTLPGRLAENVGHDGWISVILGWLISNIVLLFILALMKRYSNKSILEINTLVFGKYIGTLINLSLIAYTCFSTVILLRESEEALHITLYKLTPELILTGALIAPTIYVSWFGIKSFCRFSGFWITSIFILIIIFILAYNDFKINFIKPIGYSGIKIISNGLLPSFSTFVGMELITIFYPYVTDKDKAGKYVLIGNLISGVFYTLVVFLSTAILGENLVKHLVFPLLSVPKIISVPYIERTDLYFFGIWFPLMLSSSRAYFISMLYGIRKVLKLQVNRVYYILLVVIIILLSRIPSDFDAIYRYENILFIFGVAVNSYLIACYILSFIIKRGTEVK
ncbi:GerAB/ArcD/ProY family transporter [Candidatus Clostridium radicumherbarum]|uniref:GerAB/ArcD/ProY family transporter n=1 Tax=Candidatus Clostridium radicumherbarum TaxID=3381662 RepID=A0ABW8TVZ8_9CLOT